MVVAALGRGTEWARRIEDGVFAVGRGARCCVRCTAGRMDCCKAGLAKEDGLVAERAST